MNDNNIQRSFDLLIAKMGEIRSQGVNVPHYKEDCYWYGEWQDMNARIPYCKCKNFPADTIGPNDCESCKQYHSKYKPSKADRIRSFTDEKLADWIMSIEPAACPFRDDHGDDCHFTHCRDCWLDYLKQEATDD